MAYDKEEQVRLLKRRDDCEDILSAVRLSFQSTTEPMKVGDVLSDAASQLGAVDSWDVLAAIDVFKDEGRLEAAGYAKTRRWSQDELWRWVWED